MLTPEQIVVFPVNETKSSLKFCSEKPKKQAKEW
jgi:hypothetical protein